MRLIYLLLTVKIDYLLEINKKCIFKIQFNQNIIVIMLTIIYLYIMIGCNSFCRLRKLAGVNFIHGQAGEFS